MIFARPPSGFVWRISHALQERINAFESENLFFEKKWLAVRNELANGGATKMGTAIRDEGAGFFKYKFSLERQQFMTVYQLKGDQIILKSIIRSE